jgi:broad specificity phosphatase PhoE
VKRFLFFLFFIYWGYLSAEGAAMLYIVRHGQTDWNVERRLQGNTDIPLNEVGRAQAAELKEKLKDIEFDLCISSDLQRAVETARIVSGKQSMVLQKDKRLRERHFGAWEGRLSSEYHSALDEQRADVESDEIVQSRVFACLKEIADLHPETNILIATHGGVMRNMISKLCSIAISEIHVENMALLKVKISEQGMEIKDMQGVELPIDFALSSS